MSDLSSLAIEGDSGAAIPTIANKDCEVAPIAAPTLEIYTARRVPPPAGSWSSGHDIALTQRRSPVRIRSSPLHSLSSRCAPLGAVNLCSRDGRNSLRTKRLSGDEVEIWDLRQRPHHRGGRQPGDSAPDQEDVSEPERYRARDGGGDDERSRLFPDQNASPK